MSTTLATSQVGGLGRSSNPAGSLPFTSAADTWSLLTLGASDDGKFIKYVHPSSYVAAAPSIGAVSGSFAIDSDLSPSQITGNQNDYNPSSLSTATILRLSSDASRNITGLQGGADGRVIITFNVGSNNIVFKNQDSGSSAANRFLSTVDTTVKADESESFIYDSTTGRWRGWAMHFGVLPIARGGTNSSTTLNSDRMIISSSGAIVESSLLRPGTGSTGELRLYEGTDYVAMKAGSLSATTTWTLPIADGSSGQALTTDGAGVLSWTTISGGTSPFSATGGVITQVTSTDRLQLNIGQVGDIGLEIQGIALQSANFLDVKLLAGDAQPIFAVNPSGRIRFGPGGSTAVDTILYRSAANTLTMDHVIISGTATVGGATAVTVSPASHTAQTAEKNDVLLNAHTNAITGSFTSQRFAWFRQPTISAASSLTVTNAATVAIEGAPIASGSATLTNKYALWIQSGDAHVAGTIRAAATAADLNSIAGISVNTGNIGSITAEVSTFANCTTAPTFTITGSYATQRLAIFNNATISAGSALTVTNAATLAVTGAPVAGGSAVITNTYAFWVQDGRTRLDGPLNVSSASSLTIAGGVVTATKSFHKIDTEGAAGSDDLDTISGGKEGDILIIRAADSTHTVVAKDATGNMKLSADFSLTHADDTLCLIFNGTDWLELARSDNSA